MSKLMTVKEFISKVKAIQKQNTVYMLGTIGQPCTAALIGSCAKRLPGFYTTAKKVQLQAYVGKADAFDCVGLIKAVLWGWKHGNAPYCTNGVPDIDETTMINRYCTGVSADFENIIPGEVVWLPGHIGVYVGNGLVIECTPKWRNNVQYTGLGNVGGKKGYNTRSWTKHGKLMWLDYGEEEGNKPAEAPAKEMLEIDGIAGPLTIRKAQKVYGCNVVDGMVSAQPDTNRKWALSSTCVPASWQFVPLRIAINSGGSQLIRKVQAWCGADVDGYAGKDTWTCMQKKLIQLGYLPADFSVNGKANKDTIKAWQRWLNEH